MNEKKRENNNNNNPQSKKPDHFKRDSLTNRDYEKFQEKSLYSRAEKETDYLTSQYRRQYTEGNRTGLARDVLKIKTPTIKDNQNKDYLFLSRAYNYCDLPSEETNFAFLGSSSRQEAVIFGKDDKLLNDVKTEFINRVGEVVPVQLFQAALMFSEEKLGHHSKEKVYEFINSHFIHPKLTIEGIPAVSLDDFLKEGVGVCRHHALLLANILFAYVQYYQIPDVEIHVVRESLEFKDPEESGAHVCCVWKNTKTGRTYVLDGYWKKMWDITYEEGYKALSAYYEDGGYGSKFVEAIMHIVNPSPIINVGISANNNIKPIIQTSKNTNNSQPNLHNNISQKNIFGAFESLNDEIVARLWYEAESAGFQDAEEYWKFLNDDQKSEFLSKEGSYVQNNNSNNNNFFQQNERIQKEAHLKILALDVEGTIIKGYNYDSYPDKDGRYPAIISESIGQELKKFHEAGFKIVLATGTDGDNLKYYQGEFEKRGFLKYIDEFSPKGHSTTDSKDDKLKKYCRQFDVSKENVYFFDDAKNNVQEALNAGFVNSKQVSNEAPLEVQLKHLFDTLVNNSFQKRDVKKETTGNAQNNNSKNNISISINNSNEKEPIKKTEIKEYTKFSEMHLYDVFARHSLNMAPQNMQNFALSVRKVGAAFEEMPTLCFNIKEVKAIPENQFKSELFKPDDFIIRPESSFRELVKVKAGNLCIEFQPGGKGSFHLKIELIDRKNKMLHTFLDFTPARCSDLEFEHILPISLGTFYDSRTMVIGGGMSSYSPQEQEKLSQAYELKIVMTKLMQNEEIYPDEENSFIENYTKLYGEKPSNKQLETLKPFITHCAQEAGVPEEYFEEVKNFNDFSQFFSGMFLSLPLERLEQEDKKTIYKCALYFLANPYTAKQNSDSFDYSAQLEACLGVIYCPDNQLHLAKDIKNLAKPECFFWREKDFCKAYEDLKNAFPKHAWRALEAEELTPEIYDQCMQCIAELIKQKGEHPDIKAILGDRIHLFSNKIFPLCPKFASQCWNDAIKIREELIDNCIEEQPRNVFIDYIKKSSGLGELKKIDFERFPKVKDVFMDYVDLVIHPPKGVRKLSVKDMLEEINRQGSFVLNDLKETESKKSIFSKDPKATLAISALTNFLNKTLENAKTKASMNQEFNNNNLEISSLIY